MRDLEPPYDGPMHTHLYPTTIQLTDQDVTHLRCVMKKSDDPLFSIEQAAIVMMRWGFVAYHNAAIALREDRETLQKALAELDTGV